jgi:hypothetical protein
MPQTIPQSSSDVATPLTLSVSLGAGRKKPQAQRVAVGSVTDLARALEKYRPPGEEAWWSPHVWRDDKRAGKNWEGAAGVVIDVDYHDERGAHVTRPEGITERLRKRWRHLPGNLLHVTPRGLRLVFVFDRTCVLADEFGRAAKSCAQRVAVVLGAHVVRGDDEEPGLTAAPARAGFEIDTTVTADRGRLLFAPNALVDGFQRAAEVCVLRAEPFRVDDLARVRAWVEVHDHAHAHARAFTVVAPPATVEIEDAVAAYNRDHPRTYPRSDGDCPVCGHKGCFGTLPGSDPVRWACFSSNHTDGVGVKGQGCRHGDALDLDAHGAGRDRVEHLKACGYLKKAAAVRQGSSTTQDKEDGAFLRSNSYGSIVSILREPSIREKVLGPGALEFDEMNLIPTIGRAPITAVMLSRVRERCETQLGESEMKGYKFSREDIEDAVMQVAQDHPFHPVRDYLRSLVWDGVSRIDAIAEDILQVARTPLIVSMIRKWMISAVARAERPGCQVDTALILVGPQGRGKSTFFRVLAGEWYCATMMDLKNKDAFLQLHSAWIYEWAELETMQRASRDAVKDFLTQPFDTFRPPYGRAPEKHLRSGVIVGSTNESEFLSDPTGNRRYWPVVTPHTIDRARLTEWRDQLWAEAVAAFSLGESWHLSAEEERALRDAQKRHEVADPWEDVIRRYAEEHADGVTVAGALEAVGVSVACQTRSHQTRAGSVLLRLGYAKEKKTISTGKRAYVYVKPAHAESGGQLLAFPR